jgi:uncharacterized membrane-anchored protein/uncharacterized membrane protein (UPF0136 family)
MNADLLLQRAQASGLLPADAAWPSTEQRPWPVLLLTAVGAWFVALPMLAFIGGLLGGLLENSIALLFIGAALITVAVLLLRDRGLPLFVEQLAVPVLLVGLLCIGWRLHQSLDDQAANALLGLLCLGLTVPLPRAWLRVLLGAAAAGSLLLLSRPWQGGWALLSLPFWCLSGFLILLWAVLNRLPLPGRAAEAWEAAGAGWLLMLIAGLAVQSGTPWLLAGLSGLQPGTHMGATTLVLGSFVAAVAGLALLARAWPGLRTPRWLLLGGLLCLTALVLPALGTLALAASLCVRERRWRLATAAGLAALWVLGSFYYQLAWSLADKALGLILLGAVLALLLRRTQGRPLAAATGGRAPLALLALLLTLAVANIGIWQKETLIAEGEPVFVALAPADPRSLMQGDYMNLRFDIPAKLLPAFEPSLGARRPHLVLQRDERGVARFLRVDDGKPLAAGERRFELSPKDGGWVLVTDAWFFREGEGGRWQAARFGEFRLAPDGRALLVNLRDAELRPL